MQLSSVCLDRMTFSFICTSIPHHALMLLCLEVDSHSCTCSLIRLKGLQFVHFPVLHLSILQDCNNYSFGTRQCHFCHFSRGLDCMAIVPTSSLGRAQTLWIYLLTTLDWRLVLKTRDFRRCSHPLQRSMVKSFLVADYVFLVLLLHKTVGFLSHFSASEQTSD